MRAVFSWSYQHLDAEPPRVFRLLGLHPGPDFEPLRELAALTGATRRASRRVLDELTRAHLIQPHAAGPVRHARPAARLRPRLAGAPDDSEDERQAALTRLFDHYLHAAAAAMDTLFPAERHRRPRDPRGLTPCRHR